MTMPFAPPRMLGTLAFIIGALWAIVCLSYQNASTDAYIGATSLGLPRAVHKLFGDSLEGAPGPSASRPSAELQLMPSPSRRAVFSTSGIEALTASASATKLASATAAAAVGSAAAGASRQAATWQAEPSTSPMVTASVPAKPPATASPSRTLFPPASPPVRAADGTCRLSTRGSGGGASAPLGRRFAAFVAGSCGNETAASLTSLSAKRWINDAAGRAYGVFVLDHSLGHACRQLVDSGVIPADAVFHVPRTYKWQGVFDVLALRCSGLVTTFDRFIFLEDDLDFVDGAVGLTRAFLFSIAANLTIGQPTLTADSVISHSITRRRPPPGELVVTSNSGIVRIDAGFVEVMMPIFTQAAVQRWLPEFDGTTTVWGLDDLWGHVVRREGGMLGLIDAVAVQHIKKQNPNGEQYARVGGFRGASRDTAMYAGRLGLSVQDFKAVEHISGSPLLVDLSSLLAEPWLAPFLNANTSTIRK